MTLRSDTRGNFRHCAVVQAAAVRSVRVVAGTPRTAPHGTVLLKDQAHPGREASAMKVQTALLAFLLTEPALATELRSVM